MYLTDEHSEGSIQISTEIKYDIGMYYSSKGTVMYLAND
jgi:hypothetical protein